MLGTAEEEKMTFSFELQRMDKPVLADQHKRTKINS